MDEPCWCLVVSVRGCRVLKRNIMMSCAVKAAKFNSRHLVRALSDVPYVFSEQFFLITGLLLEGEQKQKQHFSISTSLFYRGGQF